MKQVNTLSSLEGRKLLQEVFHELRFEKQLSSFTTLGTTWRICVRERELDRFVKQEVKVLHPLGFFSGTSLWMEEIVNRFYFSTINSFVYFGAAILLVLIGLRRFSEHVSDDLVIYGIAFEALMLIFMFVIMLFTPNDDNNSLSSANENESEELISEVGEIGRDFAAMVLQLEKLGEDINSLMIRQQELLGAVSQMVGYSAQAVSPNPEMLQSMKETNAALEQFRETVKSLNESTESLKKEEIERAVRKELEKIIVGRLDKE